MKTMFVRILGDDFSGEDVHGNRVGPAQGYICELSEQQGQAYVAQDYAVEVNREDALAVRDGLSRGLLIPVKDKRGVIGFALTEAGASRLLRQVSL